MNSDPWIEKAESLCEQLQPGPELAAQDVIAIAYTLREAYVRGLKDAAQLAMNWDPPADAPTYDLPDGTVRVDAAAGIRRALLKKVKEVAP